MTRRAVHWLLHPLGGRGAWWLPDRIADWIWRTYCIPSANEGGER